MNLIDKMIESRIGRRLKKRSRLLTELKDQQTEYRAMSETLKGKTLHMDFIDKYFGERIDNIKSRIKRVEKLIERDIESYKKRNPGKNVIPEEVSKKDDKESNV